MIWLQFQFRVGHIFRELVKSQQNCIGNNQKLGKALLQIEQHYKNCSRSTLTPSMKSSTCISNFGHNSFRYIGTWFFGSLQNWTIYSCWLVLILIVFLQICCVIEKPMRNILCQCMMLLKLNHCNLCTFCYLIKIKYDNFILFDIQTN